MITYREDFQFWSEGLQQLMLLHGLDPQALWNEFNCGRCRYSSGATFLRGKCPEIYKYFDLVDRVRR